MSGAYPTLALPRIRVRWPVTLAGESPQMLWWKLIIAYLAILAILLWFLRRSKRSHF